MLDNDFDDIWADEHKPPMTKTINQFLDFFKRFRKTTEYKVLQSGSLSSLEIEVRDHIKKGWNLVGGAGFTSVKTGGNQYDYKVRNTWYQTITKGIKC